MIPTLLTKIILGINYFSLIYVILISTIYLIQLICAAIGLRKYTKSLKYTDYKRFQESDYMVPISVLRRSVFRLLIKKTKSSGSCRTENKKRWNVVLSRHSIFIYIRSSFQFFGNPISFILTPGYFSMSSSSVSVNCLQCISFGSRFFRQSKTEYTRRFPIS